MSVLQEPEVGKLDGKVVVVSGASRGIGKGMAVAMAREGATVYVTGRTVKTGEHALPGTVGETAEECNRVGGKGVAVACDHGDPEQIAALFDQVRREAGRLDILVNNAFPIPDDLLEPLGFWEKPLSNLEMWDVGIQGNFIAAWHAAQIMVPQKSGLIVSISGYAAVTYTYGVIFGTSKTAAGRPDDTRYGGRVEAAWRCCGHLVARADADRASQGKSCQDGGQDDCIDQFAKGQFGRASRARHHRAGDRSCNNGKKWRRVHHRRTGR
jgi:NADP-dependent 3-hydroxy acid dehydrogenase YdfG